MFSVSFVADLRVIIRPRGKDNRAEICCCPHTSETAIKFTHYYGALFYDSSSKIA